MADTLKHTAADEAPDEPGAGLSNLIATIRGDSIAEVAGLARKGAARVELVPLPDDILPCSRLLGTPHLRVAIGADGEPGIVALKPADLDPWRTKPAFREGVATAKTLGSFIDLVNRHAYSNSAVFVDANWQAPRLMAVIDYHWPAAGSSSRGEPPKDRVMGLDEEDELARFCRHRVSYAFPLSEPWKVWVAKNEEWMDQGEFAAFLEDHIHELAAPNGSTDERVWQDRFKTTIADPVAILDLSRGLEVKVGSTVKNKNRLQSGETQLIFETTHTDNEGRELTVPGLFLLGVPIFYRGEPARTLARLRYRVSSGGLKWSYSLHRPDEIVDAAVRKGVDEVAFSTALPVYDGAPEITARSV